MAFNISPQVNIYEVEPNGLAVQSRGNVCGATAGMAQWGAVNKPTEITKGFDEFVEKFFPPVEATATSFFIVKDFLQYNDKLLFNRVVGSNARNASFQRASSDANHEYISINSAPHLEINEKTTEPNAMIDIVVDGQVVDTVSSNAFGQARIKIPVPAGKQIVWMRLTKTTA